MKKLSKVLALAVAVCVVLSASAFAAAPTWEDYQNYLVEAAGGNAPDLAEFQGQVAAIGSWDEMPLDESPWDQIFTSLGISTWDEFTAAGGEGRQSSDTGSYADNDASGEAGSGEPSGDASAETAEVKNTADMTASDYSYLTSYTRRNDKGSIYIGHDVTENADITLNEIVEGPAYTAVYAHGDGIVVNVTGTVTASDESSGEMASDFSGQGSIIVANDGATVNVNDAVISTDGFERSALIVTELGTIRVENSELTVRGANPLTEAYEGYANSANQNTMLSPPWVLGIQGGARVINMIGTTPVLTIIDSRLVSGGWALISTDSGSDMSINVVDTEMSFLPESEGGMDSGWRIFGYDEDAYGSGYGAYFIGDPAQYYYGSTFNGVTYAAIITGAKTAHYASSNGSLVLNDVSGEPLETVEGKGQPTVINGVFGIMQHNSVSDGIYIEDGTIVNTADAIVIHKAGSGDYIFDNAVLNSEKGVLFQMIDNDDDSRVGMGNGGFSTEYNEDKVTSGIGFPGINYDYTSGQGGVSVNAAYTNGTYEGSIYNGTGYYGQRGNNLTVTLGENAVLNGDIALTSTIKGIPYSPEAIEGIAYYGDDIGYVLLDAEGNETDNEAEAAYIQIRSYTINQYFLQGHVENMIHYNGSATIAVSVENGAQWNVAGESLITRLSIAEGAVVKGTLTENADGTLTITAGESIIPAGEYGTIEAVGGGMNIGGGVDASGELNVEAAANAMAEMQNGSASGDPGRAS